MGCGPSTDTNRSPNLPQPAEAALLMPPDEPQQSEAPMRPAPQEPPHAEPQAGDVAMENTELDENFKSTDWILGVMNKEEKEGFVGALCDAAKKGNIEELGRLLSFDKGRACINQKNEDGIVPLHNAAIYSKLAVKLLLERGADVNAKDNEGVTALHKASSSNLEAVEFLVERGAEVDPISDEVGTPLTVAATMGHDSIAAYLLSKGASKEKAIETSREEFKVLAENFFVELERVIQNRKEFNIKREELNAMLISSKEPETLPTTCKGVTIGGLKKMKALVQSECEAGRFKEDKSFPDGTHCKGTMKYEELTTTDIVYRYVKDESITGKLRLIDTSLVAPEHKRIPTFFISHAWKGRFSVLLDMIFAYAEKYGLSEEAAIWIDVFSVNQHGSKECSDFSQAQNQADVQAFNNVVQTCTDGTLVVCDFEMCETYSRAWCLFEWDWTMYYHGRERLQFLGLSMVHARAGQNTIDVEKSECFKAEDKEMILREIREKHGSTTVFNEKLGLKWMSMAEGIE